MATIVVEEGKHYINRAGQKVGPMKPIEIGRYTWKDDFGGLYLSNGKATTGPFPSDSDLISECPAAASKSLGDLIAETVKQPRTTPPPLPHQRKQGMSAKAIGNMVDPSFNAQLAIDHVQAAIERLRDGRTEAAAGALFAAINTLTATVLLVREQEAA